MAKKTIKAQMKQRRDTKANWEATNPVLLDGELGIVSDDPNLYKVGDGATAWNSLPFRGFDGTLAQELGTSPNTVISQKVVSEKLTELEAFIDGSLSEFYFATPITPSDNVCTMVLGESPSLETRDRYQCFRVPVKKGDMVSVSARSGDSFPSYGFVKDGVLIFVSAKGLQVEQTFKCSGTYDEIIINNYDVYQPNPKVTLSSIKNQTEEKLTELEAFLDGSLSEFYFATPITPSDNVCTMVLGESPSLETRDRYQCFRVPVKKGDKVSVSARSGASFPSYGFVKDGVLIFVSARSLQIEQTFKCSGAYDEIIINNYGVYQPNPKVTKFETKEVNILMLGNSFTQDSMSYVPFIMQNIAPNVKLNLAIGYIGGCPLAQHCANLTGENQVLDGDTYAPINYTYQLYESGSTSWVSVGSKSIDEMLAEKKWNIITLQQNGSAAAKSWDIYYAPFIYKIHKALYEKVGRTIKLGWLLVHGAYASTAENLLENWEGSVRNTQQIQSLTANQVIFPYGTAVQNLRTTALANLGDGGNLLGDTAHLHEGIGCLAAAYANTLTILNCLGLGELSIIGEKTRPTKAWCTEKGVLSPNYGETTNDVVGITEDNCYLAQVAAIQAVKNPYEVADCSVVI